MKINAILLLCLALAGCNFSKSVKIDLISGLSTAGDLITCEDVCVTVNNQRATGNVFPYGETFYIKFNNVQGLKIEEGKVFPGMELYVVSASGDTVLQASDLYSGYSEGISLSPLLLSADVTVGKPVHSGSEYTLFIKLWDKKDRGRYNAVFNFSVVPNPKITAEASSAEFSEVYLFSGNNGKVINDNRIKVNEKNYLIIEGLSGFSETEGKVFPGLSIKATDSNGSEILGEDDLFSDSSVSGVEASDFEDQVSATFVFPRAEVKNPVKIQAVIWDKKSAARISVSTDLILEQ